MKPIDFSAPYPSARSPVMGTDAIATSHPLASQAGMEIFAAGGNAVDAAIAAAMTLTVVEPTGCGLGSDAFAILWDGSQLHGLDASGRAPADWSPDRFSGLASMPERGWEAVTVPGAVSGWAALSKRFGKLPFARLAESAIRYAHDGFQLTPIIARLWGLGGDVLKNQPGFADCFLPGGRAPAAGERFRSKGHAASLALIADTEGEAFYRGALADRIVEDARRHGAALSAADLGEHRIDWIAPANQRFAGATAQELPPAGQGIATLMALGIIEASGAYLRDPDGVAETHLAIEAMKLALADVSEHVGDRDYMPLGMDDLLDPGYLAERASLIDRNSAGCPDYGVPRHGGTICLAAGDAGGMMVSFIQSNYMGFGSGVVVPGTGISLQNRGAGFSLRSDHPNCVGPRKRPFHTIIPGFASDEDGLPLLAYGLMGGPMQSQGHVQMLMRMIACGQNPQAAADAPRWRILGGRRIAIESGMDVRLAAGLADLGHEIVADTPESHFAFGGAQILRRTADGYIAGSDPRKDGLAAAR